MIFEEVGSGGAAAGGCTAPFTLHPVVRRYGEGDTLYRVDKARRGRLEKVVIKEVRTITNRQTLTASRTLYVDTFNAMWNEWDLVPLALAVGFVEQYQWKLADEAAKLKGC